MRLQAKSVTQKKWRLFYGLPTNAASIRILLSGVKQYVVWRFSKTTQERGAQTAMATPKDGRLLLCELMPLV